MSYINLALAGTVATLSLHVFTVPATAVQKGCNIKVDPPNCRVEIAQVDPDLAKKPERKQPPDNGRPKRTDVGGTFAYRWCKVGETPKKNNCVDGSGSGAIALNLDKAGKGRVRVVVLPGQTLKDVCESAGLEPVPNTKDMCQETE